MKLSELKATAPPEEAADDWCSVWYADDNLGATPFRIFPKIYKFMREQLKDELHLNLVDHKLHCYSPMHSPEKCEELVKEAFAEAKVDYDVNNSFKFGDGLIHGDDGLDLLGVPCSRSPVFHANIILKKFAAA